MPPPVPAPLPGPHPGMGKSFNTATTGNDEKSLYDLINEKVKPGLYDSENKGFKQNIGALSQSTDIRGPTTDAPEKGVYQWHVPGPTPAPLPGPHPGQGKSFDVKQVDNDDKSLQTLLDAPVKPGLYDSEDKGFRSLGLFQSLFQKDYVP